MKTKTKLDTQDMEPTGHKVPNGDLDSKESTHRGFTDLWLEFSQSTGIHAVNKISPITRFQKRSFLWTLAICCTTSFLIYNLIGELKNFYSYPVITTITQEEKGIIEFPAVTICNRCTLNGTKVRNYSGLEEYFQATSFLNVMFPSDVSTSETVNLSIANEPLSRDWWRDLSMDAAKMFRLCVFDGQSIDCTEEFSPVFTQEGLCHTFNYNTSDLWDVESAGSDFNLIILYSVNQDDYTFRNNLASGVKVFIHDARQHPETNAAVVVAPPGFSTYIGVSITQFNYLPHPYKAFSGDKCIDTGSAGFVNPLTYYEPYTYSHCIRECIQKEALRLCGCVGPSDPQEGPVCSIINQPCYDRFLLSAPKNVSFKYQCNCPGECSYTVYDTRTSYSGFPADVWSKTLLQTTGSEDNDYMAKNILELRIFFETMHVVTFSQQPQFTENSIFSSIGGQMGLCLGASILTLAEILEFLVIGVLYLCNKLRGNMTENRVISFVR